MYICYFCRSIIDSTSEFTYFADPQQIYFKCPQCGFEYVTDNDITGRESLSGDREFYEKDLLWNCFFEFSTMFNLRIEYNQEIKWRFDHIYHHDTPMHQLMSALSYAISVVHFISYGISKDMIGAMKVAAAKARVVGIVSNVSEALARELKQSTEEVPQLHFVTYKSGIANAPHTKLVVIDGLIAFGSLPKSCWWV